MQQDNNQKYVIVAVLSFILGFGLAWLIVSNKANNAGDESKKEDAKSEVVSSEEGDEQAIVDNENLKVAEQPAGVEVAVEKVVLSSLGWLVIHESDNGIPGRILGAQLFDIGTWAGKVELLRGTTGGNTYFAMIHDDNGDRAFDPKKDLPKKEENGDVVMVSFKVTGGVETSEQ